MTAVYYEMAGHLKKKKPLIIIHYQSSLSQLPGFTHVLEKEGCSQTRVFFLCSCYDTKLNFSHYAPLDCAPLMLPSTYTLTVYFALLVLHWFTPATIFIPLFSFKWCTCTFLTRTTLNTSITSICNHYPVKQERKLPINRKGKFMLLLFDKSKNCVYLGCVCVFSQVKQQKQCTKKEQDVLFMIYCIESIKWSQGVIKLDVSKQKATILLLFQSSVFKFVLNSIQISTILFIQVPNPRLALKETGSVCVCVPCSVERKCPFTTTVLLSKGEFRYFCQLLP